MKIPVFSFKTLGCRLNQAEEERLRREVLEAGYYISNPKTADICIVNTCSVTVLADKKSHQVIKKLKTENCKLKIIVIGCGAEAARDYPEVSLWIPNKEKPNTLKLIRDKLKLSESKLIRNSEFETCPSGRRVQNSSARTRALLKVQDGCNNFCAYCIVPHLRGREVSVPVEGVLEEAKKLEALGYKELVISGVNVGRYNDQVESEKLKVKSRHVSKLFCLLKTLLKETNFKRIRLSSINPQDINDELIELWAVEARLCRHFHLSLQSGSNNVLKNMGRPYTREQYLKLCKKITQKIPEMAITTDVIVGFPGETEQDFNDTLELVKSAKLAKLHVFRYSPRTGTRAAVMPEQISDTVKKERSEKLIKVGEELQKAYKKQFIGQEVEVLFEEQKGGYWYGLTSNYIRIKHKSAEDLENKFLKIRLNKNNLA